jgi:NitT/TauT family transport system substrate-binding protein
MFKNRAVFAIVMALLLAVTMALPGCGAAGADSGASGDASGAASGAAAAAENNGESASSNDNDAAGDVHAAVEVRVASLKGPTSIGLAEFNNEETADGFALINSYDFTIAGTADEIVPKILSDEIDIALLPANLAAVLYNRTEGGIQVLNINTLGVLYLVSANSTIAGLKDLSGHTVFMTGKGTTPEYVVNALLAAQGINDVNLEYKSEATELAAAVSADSEAIAIMPQPYATVVTAQNPNLKICANLTDEWDASFSDGSRLVTGVTVVRTQFAQEHPVAVAEFMAQQKASVAAVNANPANAADKVVEMGIIANAGIAQKAIPFCSLVSIEGSEMATALSGYLTTLFAQAPESIGGSMPQANFYYQRGSN